MMDDCRKLAPATRQVHLRQLAFKDRILQMVAEIAHGVVNRAQPLFIANVVADKIRSAHCYSAVRANMPNPQCRPEPMDKGPATGCSNRRRRWTAVRDWR